jgi:hypothetical protein
MSPAALEALNLNFLLSFLAGVVAGEWAEGWRGESKA